MVDCPCAFAFHPAVVVVFPAHPDALEVEHSFTVDFTVVEIKHSQAVWLAVDGVALLQQPVIIVELLVFALFKIIDLIVKLL